MSAPSRSSKPTALAPQQAVQEYLNTLLQEATSQAIEQEVPVEAKVESPVERKTEIRARPAEPVVKPAPPVVAPAPVSPPVVETTPAAVEPEADSWIDGRPPWAQQRFECLLFKVSGLLLAVPLVELGGVLVMDEELTPLFGQPDWFMGLLPSKTEGTVKVIDTARWVMPERYSDESREGLKYVVMMENSEWGLACHEVADAVTLEPHQVNWRSDRGRRPWLAGTVIEHMCAIMDVAAFVKLLAEQSRSRTR
ncbi:chemotaxis protein CheW [Motiliproteus sediminis]|uniref:chemotaxis protein CheW n=1 Tax=Motiliproteus sediminis TaxID=1468178 RepID=UPI001AF015CE|nr:chemotaxis protein CheW [Motiliproteus sediminis]